MNLSWRLGTVNPPVSCGGRGGAQEKTWHKSHIFPNDPFLEEAKAVPLSLQNIRGVRGQHQAESTNLGLK